MVFFNPSFFPLSHKKNVRLFYCINGGLALWFVEAIWYFYWGNFADFRVLGGIFAGLSLVSLLLEIPTGALADMFGRKKATIVGCVSLAIGSIIYAFAQDYWYLIIGGVIQSVGRAFISGSLEALIYDDLKQTGEERFFDQVMSAKSRINTALYAFATITGGFAYTLFFRLPHILTALVGLVVGLASFGLKEVKLPRRPKTGIKEYVFQNIEGFRQLNSRGIKPYLTLILLGMILFHLYDWGFSKPAMALGFGYGASGQGIIYTVMALINVWFLTKFPQIRKKIGDFMGVIVINGVLSIGFILSSLPFGYTGIAILLLIEMAGSISDPWVSVIVNNAIISKDRATTLSSLEFLSKVPFIVLVFLSGESIENNALPKVHVTLGIGVLFLTALLWYRFNRQAKSVQLSGR